MTMPWNVTKNGTVNATIRPSHLNFKITINPGALQRFKKQFGATEHQLNFFSPVSPIGMLMSSGWFKRRNSVCRFCISTPTG